jgi:hypothetical protein
MLLLKTFLNESAEQDSLRTYQRDRWGRVNGGETCIIELSGLAVKSSKKNLDRDRFREERIENIRAQMHAFAPKFMILYGVKDKTHWEELAGCTLLRDVSQKSGPR